MLRESDSPARLQLTGAEKGSVSIWFVRKALAALERRGLDPEPALRRAAISPELLAFDQARVSPSSFAALWLTVAAALDDEFFALDARRMKVGSFAGLCWQGLGAGNLKRAMHQSLRYINLLLDDTQAETAASERGEVQLVLRTLRPVPDIPFAHETLLIMLHGVLCWLIGKRIPITRAGFAYARPPWWREYLQMFASDLSFKLDATRIAFSAAHLAAPIVQSPRSVSEFLRRAPENIILKYRNPDSASARIRRRLRALAFADWPTIQSLARELRLSPATLHRRLAAEGASFQEIKDALRRDEAIAQLSHSAASIAEIGSQLGFAEPSSFQRAFRQWTGVSPGAYRRSLRTRAP